MVIKKIRKNFPNPPSFNFTDSGIDDIHLNKFGHFNVHRQVLADPSINGYAYIFFSRPDLNLNPKYFGDKSNIFFNSIYHMTNGGGTQDKAILQQLTTTHQDLDTTSDNINSKSNYMNLLSNAALSFTPQDTTVRTKDVGETFTGYKVTIPGPLTDSISGTFNIEYEESIDLPILKLHRIWVDYMDYCRRGFIHPNKKYVTNRGWRVLDFVSSVYYFMVKPDGETITYFAKYTGVFPTAIPYSSLNYQQGTLDTTKISISYAFSFKEDLDPNIISDFNKLANASPSGKNIYNPKYASPSAWKKGSGGTVFNSNVKPTKAYVKRTNDSNNNYKLVFF